MIISRTPFRLSFFGGGTDYPVWFREHGGAVLSATINRYSYISSRFLPPFFEHKSRIVWSRIERVAENDEIEHPVVRAALAYLGIDRGVEIHHNGDLPARSGLGSSSSFTVGILHALHALLGRFVDKAELARQAIHLEQDVLHEHVGVQDQIQTAHGGFNRIVIRPDGNFTVEPMTLPRNRLNELQAHLLMLYTGVSRTASRVAREKIAAIPKKRAELRAMQQMVDEATRILADDRDITEFGRLLHESWQIKRSLAKSVSPSFVDEIYERARTAGAIGGKLMGAGGGGFIVLFARPEDHRRVLDALPELLLVPIRFEFSGSQIIFCEPETYSRMALTQRDFRR